MSTNEKKKIPKVPYMNPLFPISPGIFLFGLATACLRHHSAHLLAPLDFPFLNTPPVPVLTKKQAQAAAQAHTTNTWEATENLSFGTCRFLQPLITMAYTTQLSSALLPNVGAWCLDHLLLAVFGTITVGYVVYQRFLAPLAGVPGPFWASLSVGWLIRRAWKGDLHRNLIRLHEVHGPLVRVSPSQV